MAPESQQAAESRRSPVVVVAARSRVVGRAGLRSLDLGLAGYCERCIGKPDRRPDHRMFVRLELALLQHLPQRLVIEPLACSPRDVIGERPFGSGAARPSINGAISGSFP